MPILMKPSGAFPTALVYITLGVLVDIWTIVAWIFYPPGSAWNRFMVVGFMASGLALFIIGLFLGRIGRSARDAELPPTEVTADVSAVAQQAATHPPVVVPPTTPVQAPTMPPAAPQHIRIH